LIDVDQAGGVDDVGAGCGIGAESFEGVI